MSRLLQWPSQALKSRLGGSRHERTASASHAPTRTIELGVSLHAERCAVSELLEIAKTVLTLDIAFESRIPEPAAAPGSTIPGRLNVPVVLKDGQVYGMLWCADEERRTAMGNRAADALRTVAVLVGHEVDRHRRMLS